MTTTGKKIEGLNILLGVSGGIAAYKAVAIASKLTAAGAQVDCVLTKNACRFVTPLSFKSVTARTVYHSMWNENEPAEIDHISIAERSEIVIVAPATANIIAKTATGICDDLLSTTLCTCFQHPTLLAPAMNENMWESPAVKSNIETLRKRGIKFIGPETGRLACGTSGQGRMSEPETILNAIENLAENID
jgi:phosphopantothenoylcysteine decarboxylase/phosphopantothenate--cysteine ligase